jgi:hypothetical protein
VIYCDRFFVGGFLADHGQHTLHFDLQNLSEANVVALRGVLQALAEDATSRQMMGERLVVKLFESLRDAANDGPACLLVRCFQTATYARMPTHYQYSADQLLIGLPVRPGVPAQRPEMPSQEPGVLDQMRCLSLLATHGVKSVWNDVMTSVGHQAIPLPSVEVVQKAPMIAKLLQQLGMSIERAVAPPDSPDFQVQATDGSFSVFHIAQAVGSPFIPAQESFVTAYGVRSVVGMGGVLPDGELIAVLLFTSVPISEEVAKRFEGLADEVRTLFGAFPAAATFGRVED